MNKLITIITPPASWQSSQILCEISNNSYVLKKRTTPYYIIIPIYKAVIDNNVLNKSINGYKFISSEQFHKEYSKNLYDANNLLENDIKLPIIGTVITRPIAKYVLIKEIELNDGNTQSNIGENEAKLKSEFDYINTMINAFHLLNSGTININKVYILSNNSSANYMIKSSTSLYEIKNHYLLEDQHSYYIPAYNITIETLKQVSTLIDQLLIIGDKYTIPLFYFNKYFSSYDIIDKLVNLSIVWESTILTNQKNELRYTLAIRGSYLLHKDLSEILKVAYDTRSEIVHNGNITNKILNKIKKIIGIENEIDFGILFNFITKYLEPITRNILMAILLKLFENQELNISTFVENLDKDISKSFE